MVLWMPWSGWMAGAMWLLFPLMVVAAVFWLWMLIDCLSRKKFEDKLVWVIVMVFLLVIGSILYYFIVYTKRRK